MGEPRETRPQSLFFAANGDLDRSRAILIQNEPSCIRHLNKTWGEYAEPEDIGYAATWTIKEHHFPLDWYLNATYSALYVTNPNFERCRVISAVQTEKRDHPGQRLRYEFVKNHLSLMQGFDLFGRSGASCDSGCYTDNLPCYLGPMPMRAKDAAMFPYKYHFCAENSSERNYFSEKIGDAFLAYCLPFYWGCPNLEDFFPADSFIRVPIARPGEAMQIIAKAIQDDEWVKRLPAIAEARRLVMDKYQVWPVIEKMIREL